MKKILSAVIILAGIAVMSGCGSLKLKLTASEHDKIAEYAAYALLSDSAGYRDKLISMEEVEKVLEERALAEKIAKEMEELNNGQGGDKEPSTKPGDDSGDNTGETGGNEKTIAEILKLDGVDVQYAGYEFCRSYPNDSEAMFGMQATSGNKFIVLSFVMQNTSMEAVSCDILSGKPVCRLSIGGKTYMSQMTVLDNDLSTYKKELAGGSFNMAFLLFQVPESLSDSDCAGMKLSFRKNEVTQSVTLK